MPSPRVAHQFNTFTHGGAAIAAIRIARSLKDAGCRVSFWCRNDAGRAPVEGLGGGSLHYAKPHRYLHRLNQARWHMGRRKNPAVVKDFSLPCHFEKPKFYPERYGDGILHFHWVGGDFFDYAAFFSSVPDEHPIVWTLHDLNPLTGGCHYAGQCRGFEKACGNCPQLVKPKENDVTRRAMETKLRVLKGKNLHLVAPSHWMEAQIRASSIGKLAKSVRTIHYPLDLDAFSPLHNREEARHILGITSSEPIIGFGAFGADDPRKGLAYLIQALMRVQASGTPFQLLVFGSSPPKELEEANLPCKCVGRIDDQPALRAIYNAADLYALPSLEDNSPQTGIEAIACGTPVVGFKSGGIVDYVKPDVSGFLAETGNTEKLAWLIKEALSNLPRLKAMRASARALAVELFEPRRQAQKYLDLYGEICTLPRRHL